ncbi:unnamed protein product [Anisakis simplex]|uniref:Uncharacterized protein n=1 Tax=Anisakis simplex TaxID=6269 RepID=A0A0M3JZK5_ANISI|nr:unnamed protein product [Anisakis simplex]
MHYPSALHATSKVSCRSLFPSAKSCRPLLGARFQSRRGPAPGGFHYPSALHAASKEVFIICLSFWPPPNLIATYWFATPNQVDSTETAISFPSRTNSQRHPSSIRSPRRLGGQVFVGRLWYPIALPSTVTAFLLSPDLDLSDSYYLSALMATSEVWSRSWCRSAKLRRIALRS